MRVAAHVAAFITVIAATNVVSAASIPPSSPSETSFQGPVLPGIFDNTGSRWWCSWWSNAPGCAVPNKLVILHTNDLHSHYDEATPGGVPCSPAAKQDNNCVGGVSRIKTLVDQYRATNDNVLLLDAGDQIVGTLFYNRYGFEPSVEFMNELKYDAMSIGNHEFDENVTFAADFIKELQFPVLSSNIDLDTAPGLYENGLRPFLLLRKYGLGIVGYITKNTASVSKGANNVTVFDPVKQVQEYVDILRQKHGIRRIICVSHNGYDEDQHLAANTQGIDLIVGGHSHTLLSSNASLPGVKGPYPTAVKSLDGKTTWVVQAHRYADYLGHIELEWDEHGHLLAPRGEAILLDQSIPQDPKIQARVEELAEGFSELTDAIVGYATDDFSGPDCYKEECPMGVLIAECMRSHASTDGAHIGFTNAGGIRASFPQGDISKSDVFTIFPFGNFLATFEYTGQQLLDLLEWIGSGKSHSIAHWGGLRVVYNSTAPAGSRVQHLSIDGQPLDLNAVYKIAAPDFVAAGGDNIMKPVKFKSGAIIANAMNDCLEALGTVTPMIDGRLAVIS